MGLRTFSVRGGSRGPSNLDAELYDKNIDIGSPISFPDGEYSNDSRGMYPRAMDLPDSAVNNDVIDLEGEYSKTDRALNKPLAGAVRPDAVSGVLDKDGNPYPNDPEKTNTDRSARIAAAGIDAIGGIVNANTRHQDYVTANNLRIMQANRQKDYIRADAARAVLREGTKATDRKGNALLNAVAQGQSAGGDLAQTAMSAEDVYAAQNTLNIEINAMRSIYGLEIEQSAMESNNRISNINRNASIAQNIINFGARSATAGS